MSNMGHSTRGYSLRGLVFVLLSLSLHMSARGAPPTAVPESGELVPTMAGFYRVDEQGRLIADKPVTPTYAFRDDDRSVAEEDKSQANTERPANVGRQPPSVTLVIHTTVNGRSQPTRCEQRHFFRTADGRCIVPVIKAPESGRPGRREKPYIRSAPWRPD